jgi:hypothetical protein
MLKGIAARHPSTARNGIEGWRLRGAQTAGPKALAERSKIGPREIQALAPNQEVWDSSVAGFGARRQRSEAVSYVLTQP